MEHIPIRLDKNLYISVVAVIGGLNKKPIESLNYISSGYFRLLVKVY